MARLYVALVELEGRIVAHIVSGVYCQILVAVPCTPLASLGLKQIHWNARRNTGVAMCAMRAIDVAAAAPKAQLREVAIEFLVNRLARIDKQGGGFLVLQIAAAMGVGGVHLEIPHG
jgi:hypothetical protein